MEDLAGMMYDSIHQKLFARGNQLNRFDQGIRKILIELPGDLLSFRFAFFWKGMRQVIEYNFPPVFKDMVSKSIKQIGKKIKNGKG